MSGNEISIHFHWVSHCRFARQQGIEHLSLRIILTELALSGPCVVNGLSIEKWVIEMGPGADGKFEVLLKKE